MSGVLDPGGALALIAALIVIAMAVAIARARSMLVISLMLAVLGGGLALGLLALDAPDAALIAAIIGVGIVPLFFLGVMVLTAPSARRSVGKFRVGALVASAAVGAALIFAASDLPVFGGSDVGAGRVFVNRAALETGVRNAVAAVTGNYRALDALAQIAALMAAGVGVYALLGFGERAEGARERKETPP